MFTLIKKYGSINKRIRLGDEDLWTEALYEDADGIRWFIVEQPMLINKRDWTDAHANGAMALLLPTIPGAITAERFADVRIDDGFTFAADSAHWSPFIGRVPSYPELLAAETPAAEPEHHGFTHLHLHSEYSALDGLSTVQEIVDKAVADGQTAVALTDHGVCAGHPALQRACDKAGIKPIFGLEAYFVDDRLIRPVPGDKEHAAELKKYTHLILLAQNDVGLRNLWAISTEGYRDGHYWKPRIDWDTLRRHAEGIIATSACLGGPLSAALLAGNRQVAKLALGRFLEIFDDRFYLEIQPNNLEEQERLNIELAALSEEMGVPLVVGVDAHYPTAEMRGTHEMWIRCQTNADAADDYWHFEHMQDEHEARSYLSYLDPAVVDAAIANTGRIAGACTARIESKVAAPVFSKDGGAARDAERLLDLCMSNWSKVEHKTRPVAEYTARFGEEMELLIDKGFCGYFLLVADYVGWAKSNGILVGPGRGSGGGSLVAYLSGITEIDPVELDLLFARFMTKGRVAPPDFDLDFPSSKREVLQDYLREKYGEDYVIRVGTHLRYGNKGIFSKLFSALKEELPPNAYVDQGKISTLITEAEAGTAGLGLSWEDLWTQIGDVLGEYRDQYPQLFAYAERLVGRLNSYGRHAAGMVVSLDDPLTDRFPLRLADDGSSMISQFEYPDLEEQGLLKLDLLTLRTLDTIQKTVDLVAERRGVKIHFPDWKVEYDDPQVWDVISAGETLGIFQIETSSGTALAKRMRPQSLTDLTDMITLVRPGPARSGLTDAYLRRREGAEEVSVPDPRLEPVLAPTQGAMIYQEQVMAACMLLAGYDSTEADGVRKILGKKKVEQVFAAGQKFVAGCVENGMPETAAAMLWAQMAEFAKYSFGKAHAAAYAILAYWCAWLKVHYPMEFRVGTMSTVDKDRVPEFIKEARRIGMRVLPPDINSSGFGFQIAEGVSIRYGLDAIKGVGTAAVKAIQTGQPYADFADYLERKESAATSAVTLKLAQVGAFDALEPNRHALVQRLEAEKDGSAAQCVFKSAVPTGAPNDLPCTFDWASEPRPVNQRTGKALKPKPAPKKCTKACRNYTPPPPLDPTDVRSYTPAEIREIEAEMLGGHLSSTVFDDLHPDDRDMLREQAEAIEDGPMGVYTVAGLITRVRPYRPASSPEREMGFIGLDTEGPELDVVCFNNTWEPFRPDLVRGLFVFAQVKKSPRDSQTYGLQLVTLLRG